MNPSSQVGVQPPDVFVRSATWEYRGSNLAVFPFAEPAHLQGVSRAVTTVYFQELLRVPLFSSIKLLSQNHDVLGETLKIAQMEGCNTVLVGNVVDVFEGSGAQGAQMEISLQLLDAQTGRTLWYLQQHAFSLPGADVDLFWKTLPGESGYGYKVLSRLLAEQFANLLAEEVPGS